MHGSSLVLCVMNSVSTLVLEFFEQAQEGLKHGVKMLAGLECGIVRRLVRAGAWQVPGGKENKSVLLRVIAGFTRDVKTK